MTMNRAFRRLLVACLGSLLGTAAFAQPDLFPLRGLVTGWDGPIAGATLTLEMEGLPPKTIVTDESGLFLFEGLPAGPYRLKIQVPEVRPFEHTGVIDALTAREELIVDCHRTRDGGSGTVTSRPLAQAGPMGFPQADDDEGFAEVEIFYGTDRKLRPDGPVETRFGPERMSIPGIHLGVGRVSIPRDHRMGQIERPSIWKFEVTPDPRKHVVLLGIEPLSKQNFYQRLQGTIGKSGEKELMVFVHGFNVSFHDAALRTGQLAYDLGLDGAPVLYSWPSMGSVKKYTVDEGSVEWTVPHLEGFLRELSERSGAKSIYLIAHSMGNRALTRALERIALKMKADAKAPFRQIVLTAPDVDAGVFADLAQNFRRAGERVTLYASSNDEALKISKRVHGYQRAGETAPDVLIVPGVDTIDVSSVDTSFLGHSYFGDNCSVIADLMRLLRKREPPERRTGLAKKQKAANLSYWTFAGAGGCPATP